MSRFLLLDRGEELSEATAAALGAAERPVPLRLLEPAPPFREGQVVHVRGGAAGAAGGILLCRHDGAFRLLPRPAGEVLGPVVAVQRGAATFSLERGLLPRVPARWLGPAVDALEVLARFSHPLTPPLFQGSAADLLARVSDKYGSAPEVRQYEAGVESAGERFERELLARHVRPGGRVLDVGCGAGREALAFARAGFRVVGIDIAPAMVEAARRHAARAGLAIEFRALSVTAFDDPPGSYDGAFFSGSIQHIPGRALRVDALRRIGRTLTPEGALVLAVMYREPLGWLSRTRVVDLLRALGARLLGPGRFSEPGDGWMREVSEGSDARVPVFFHDYAGPAEVRGEIEAAGLTATEVDPSWWVGRPGQFLTG